VWSVYRSEPARGRARTPESRWRALRRDRGSRGNHSPQSRAERAIEAECPSFTMFTEGMVTRCAGKMPQQGGGGVVLVLTTRWPGAPPHRLRRLPDPGPLLNRYVRGPPDRKHRQGTSARCGLDGDRRVVCHTSTPRGSPAGPDLTNGECVAGVRDLECHVSQLAPFPRRRTAMLVSARRSARWQDPPARLVEAVVRVAWSRQFPPADSVGPRTPPPGSTRPGAAFSKWRSVA